MFVAVHLNPQREKLAGPVAESWRIGGGNIEHQRHGVAGLADYPLDAKGRETVGVRSVLGMRTTRMRRRGIDVAASTWPSHQGEVIKHLS